MRNKRLCLNVKEKEKEKLERKLSESKKSCERKKMVNESLLNLEGKRKKRRKKRKKGG